MLAAGPDIERLAHRWPRSCFAFHGTCRKSSSASHAIAPMVVFMKKNNVPQLGVSGEYTTDGRPHGSTSLTPFLAITNAREAVEFYRSVFAARVVDITEMGGVVVHAELDFGTGRLQIGEPSPDFGLVPAPEGEASCYSIGYYC